MAFFLFSCQPRLNIKPTVPVEAQPLQRTFGDVRLESKSDLLIGYKDIQISLNKIPSAAVPVDYLLFSAAVEPAKIETLRKEQKILTPAASVGPLLSLGFRFVKSLVPGRMMQFTKNNAVIFARSAQGEGGSQGTESYFLEFDNGRNIMFLAEGCKADDLRPFLYSLRDEGKEIHLLFSPVGPSNRLAEIIELLMPQEAVIVGVPSSDQQVLKTHLKGQFFQGILIFANAGDTIPF